MYVVVWQLCHRLHDDGKFLHARNILDHVQLRPADSNVPEEMQEQIVSGAYPMNVTDRGILGARISRHHHVAFLLRLNKLLCYVTLDHFMREVPTQRVATDFVDLEALLQRQTAGLLAARPKENEPVQLLESGLA